jgi:hypothetical protein
MYIAACWVFPPATSSVGVGTPRPETSGTTTTTTPSAAMDDTHPPTSRKKIDPGYQTTAARVDSSSVPSAPPRTRAPRRRTGGARGYAWSPPSGDPPSAEETAYHPASIPRTLPLHPHAARRNRVPQARSSYGSTAGHFVVPSRRSVRGAF